MARILGFDFGTGHIGCAVGNTVLGTANSIGAIKAKDGIPDKAEIAKLFSTWQPEFIVVGLPLNMDGTEQLMTKRARKFGNRLANEYRLKVVFVDERLSSASAKEEIFARGGFKALKNGKEQIDALSAQEILEQYLSENH